MNKETKELDMELPNLVRTEDNLNWLKEKLKILIQLKNWDRAKKVQLKIKELEK